MLQSRVPSNTNAELQVSHKRAKGVILNHTHSIITHARDVGTFAVLPHCYATVYLCPTATVCAEAYDPDEEDDDSDPRVVHPKSDGQRRRLQDACSDILLFKTLDQVQPPRTGALGITYVESGWDRLFFQAINYLFEPPPPTHLLLLVIEL